MIHRLTITLCVLALLALLGLAVGEAKAFHNDDIVEDCAADLGTLAAWDAMRKSGVSLVQAIPQIVPTEQFLAEYGLSERQKRVVRERTRKGIELVWEKGLSGDALVEAYMGWCRNPGTAL